MNKDIASRIEELVNSFGRSEPPVRFTEDDIELLNNSFTREELKKNSFLVRKGETEKSAWFVEEGILRHWAPVGRSGKTTFWFSFTGGFAGSYNSTVRGKPSEINIQTVCRSVVWKIMPEDMANALKSSIEINRATRIIMEEIFWRTSLKILSLLSQTPEERFKNLTKEVMGHSGSIPEIYLASFVGITPQAYCRIQKRLLKPEKKQ